jgi:hypothetical protein
LLTGVFAPAPVKYQDGTICTEYDREIMGLVRGALMQTMSAYDAIKTFGHLLSLTRMCLPPPDYEALRRAGRHMDEENENIMEQLERERKEMGLSPLGEGGISANFEVQDD